MPSPAPEEVPVLRFTEAARAVASSLAAEPRHQGLVLRVYIADKNCDGFLYGVAFDDEMPGDVRVLLGGEAVAVVDAQGAPYVWGSLVDFVDGAQGKGFVVSNPHQSLYRGRFFLPPDRR